MLRNIAVLGSTGSIGTQTLEIVRLFPDRLRVCALAAHSNVDLLVTQAAEFLPAVIVVGDEARYGEVKQKAAHLPVEVLAGQKGLAAAAVLRGGNGCRGHCWICRPGFRD